MSVKGIRSDWPDGQGRQVPTAENGSSRKLPKAVGVETNTDRNLQHHCPDPLH